MRVDLASGFGIAAIRIGGEHALRQRNEVVRLHEALSDEEPQAIGLDRPAEHRVHFPHLVQTIALFDERPHLVADVVVLKRFIGTKRPRDT
jgi:hypothetical protein